MHRKFSCNSGGIIARHLHNAAYLTTPRGNTMRKIVLVLALLSAPLCWAGDAIEKPFISATQTVAVTAIVEAIDHETREVTLLLGDEERVTFTASAEARNLEQVAVGDRVMAEYVQSMTIEVVAGDGSEAAVGSMTAMARTEHGDMPGMVAVDTVVITATVEEINIEANTFKLKNAAGEVHEYVARDPKNLKLAEVGDLVVITLTEAIAVVVEAVPADHEM